MSVKDYAGIDYGLGHSNLDPATGIRYGVMSANTPELTDWFWDSVEPIYSQYCP